MVYYETMYGDIITSDDLEKAFFIVTGAYPNESKNTEKEFWNFREKCFGKSIKQVVIPSVDLFLRSGKKLMAIKFYKDWYNCGLREAKESIERMIENNEKYRNIFKFV
jgi:ribosomal protein L7/L12